MVVCKFFQQGYCRYGQNCRFEHVYGSKYSYHANPQPQPARPQISDVTDEQLVSQAQADIQAALRGGQWILSCYAPFKEKPLFPGISDLSPEEARLFIYEAKANNNVDQAVAYMNNLFKEARLKYEQLLQPNVTIIKVLRSLYKGEIVSSPFTNTAQGAQTTNNASNNASSIFRSAVQTSPFNQNTNQNAAQSIFSQAQNSPFAQPYAAKEIFSQAMNQNHPFPSPEPNSAKSIFASAAQNTFSTNQRSPANIFATANQAVFINEQKIAQNNSPFFQNNVFEKANTQMSVFNTSNVNNTDVSGVYSKMEELSEEDIEAFKSERFQLGLIPEVPPPHSLC